jgi:CRP/FNR family cyclic AMP-dependent transcriptional regulator
MASIAEALARVPLFARLSPAELAAVESVAKTESFGPDTVLFFEGDRGDAMYVVTSGSVTVSRSHDDGSSTILSTMGSGEIVGELAVLDDSARSATVTTVGPTQVLALHRNDFRALAGRHPDLLWHVVEALCARVRATGAQTMALVYDSAPYRVVDRLAALAEKHGQTDDASGKLVYDVRIAAISQAAGTDDRATKRILRMLEQKQLVTLTDDSVRVTDLYSLGRAREYAREWS